MMANSIKKLPFPDFLCVTPCEIRLDEPDISEDGEPKAHAPIKAFCIYSERRKRLYDKDGKYTELVGKVIVKGDIAPKMREISSGTITIHEREMAIYSGIRAKNPDGTVNHMEFELK